MSNEYDREHIDEPVCQCIKCARFCHIDGVHNCGGYTPNKQYPNWTWSGRNTSLWFVPTEKQIQLQKELDDNRKPSIIPDKEFHEQYELLRNDINKTDK